MGAFREGGWHHPRDCNLRVCKIPVNSAREGKCNRFLASAGARSSRAVSTGRDCRRVFAGRARLMLLRHFASPCYLTKPLATPRPLFRTVAVSLLPRSRSGRPAASPSGATSRPSTGPGRLRGHVRPPGVLRQLEAKLATAPSWSARRHGERDGQRARAGRQVPLLVRDRVPAEAAAAASSTTTGAPARALAKADRIDIEVHWAGEPACSGSSPTSDAELFVGRESLALPYQVCLSELLFGAPLYRQRRLMAGRGLPYKSLLGDASKTDGADAGTPAAVPATVATPARPRRRRRPTVAALPDLDADGRGGAHAQAHGLPTATAATPAPARAAPTVSNGARPLPRPSSKRRPRNKARPPSRLEYPAHGLRPPHRRTEVAGPLAGGRPAPDARRTRPSPSSTRSTCSPTRRAPACTSATARATPRPTSSRAGSGCRASNVLHPMGWDAFGLPAENYAIKHGVHPRIDDRRGDRQLPPPDRLGRLRLRLGPRDRHHRPRVREVDAVDLPAALRARPRLRGHGIPINWCPSCKTGLANEEVSQGRCERCGTPSSARTCGSGCCASPRYADRLLEDLAQLDWPESTLAMQRNWIGRSEGAEVDVHARPTPVAGREIRVFTTRPDTLYGATYMVLAPEHPLVDDLTTPAQREAVAAYQAQARRKSDLERTDLAKEKTGVVHRRARAINPVNGERDPDLDRRLRARRATAPARSWPCPRTTSATSSSRRSSACRSCTVVEPDGRRARPTPDAAVHRRRRRRQLGPARRAAHGRGKKTITAELEAARHRQARGQLPAARLGVLAPALLGRADPAHPLPDRTASSPVPEAQLPVRLPDVERYEPTGTGESPLAAIDELGQHHLPDLRRRRRSARPTPCRSGRARAGTTCATSTRRTTRARFDPSGGRSSGCRSTSTSAAPSTRCCTCSTRASGTRCCSTSAIVSDQGAVQEAAPPGHGARVLYQDAMGRYHELGEIEFRGDEAFLQRRRARS